MAFQTIVLGRDLRSLAAVTWYTAFLIGLFGNCFIISTMSAILKQRKNTPNVLILLLSVVDLICILCTYIVPAVVYVTGRYIDGDGSMVCNIQTFVVVYINTLSILIVMTIYFERYYAVAKPYSYQEHMSYTHRKFIAFILLCVVMAVAISLPTIVDVVGNNSNVVYFPGTFCMIEMFHLKTLRQRFNVIFYVAVLSVAIALAVFGNVLAIYRVRKMSTFRQQHSINHNQDGSRRSEEYLFIRLCLVTCTTFVLLWSPLLVSPRRSQLNSYHLHVFFISIKAYDG
jgi:7 transmembrane receptor (rhodopsin family).